MLKRKIVIILILAVILILIYFLMNRNKTPNEETNDFYIGEEIITVVGVDVIEEHISYDGGVTWDSNNEPSFYMNLEEDKYPVDVENIVGHLYNNYSDRSVRHGYHYTLYKWNGREFKEVEFPSDMAFPDMGLIIKPGETEELNFQIQRLTLDEGRYLIEKKIRISEQHSPDDREEYIVTSEFYLE